MMRMQLTSRAERASLWVAGLVLLVMGIVTIALFVHAQRMMEAQVKGQLRETAFWSARLFKGEELDAIRGQEDMETPLFESLVDRLEEIRRSNENIRFTYLMRRTEDPMQLEFVADADAFLLWEEHDEDGDGIITAEEMPSLPGDLYSIMDVPKMQHEAFLHPVTDEEFSADQWGTFLSAYAPVLRRDGTVAGIVGIDVEAVVFQRMVTSIISPVILLLLTTLSLLVAFYIFSILRNRRLAYLVQLEDERTSLLQLVMHQLGEPLTILKWSLESMAAGCSKEEQQVHVQQMEHAVSWLKNIFEGFMKADQVREQELHFHPEKVPFLSVCNDVRAELSEKLAQKRQTLTVAAPPALTLLFSRQIMAGVLREIVGNASAFSPEGTKIHLRARAESGKLLIQVEDQGCGVPKREQERVFERFTRGSNASMHKTTGNGLGLYVVRTIIERAGGRVWLRSKKGKGTTVFIEMPMHVRGV